MIVTSEVDGTGLTFHREDVRVVRQSAAGCEVWVCGVEVALGVSAGVAEACRVWVVGSEREGAGKKAKKTR